MQTWNEREPNQSATLKLLAAEKSSRQRAISTTPLMQAKNMLSDRMVKVDTEEAYNVLLHALCHLHGRTS